MSIPARFTFFVLTAGCAASPVLGASFDCRKASTAQEHMVCNVPELSVLDERLATAYKKAFDESDSSPTLKTQQRTWIREVRNACATEPCLASVMRQRIAELNAFPGAPPAPTRATATAPQPTPVLAAAPPVAMRPAPAPLAAGHAPVAVAAAIIPAKPLIPMAPVAAPPQAAGYAPIGLLDLKTDIRQMLGRKVAVTGGIQMAGEMAALKTDMMDMTPVWLDVSQAPREQRKVLLSRQSEDDMPRFRVSGMVTKGPLGMVVLVERLESLR